MLPQQRDVVTERTAAGLPAERAAEWLRALGKSLQAPEKSKEKADLLHAILRARSGLTTEQLIYSGRALGWLVIPSLEPA